MVHIQMKYKNTLNNAPKRSFLNKGGTQMAFENEEYVMLQNESDRRKCEKQMALYGYETCETEFFDTKDYEKLIIELIKNKMSMIYDNNLPYRKLKIIKSSANKVIISETKDIDRLVMYIKNPKKLQYKFTAEIGKVTEENYDIFISYLNKNAKLIDVTELPIKWRQKGFKNGQINKVYEMTSDLEKIRNFPLFFTDIRIMNQADDLTASVLVHEMTHALLDRHKGIISNILHDEVLSIYMELLTAYKIDNTEKLLNIAMQDRLLNFKSQIIEKYLNEYNGCMFNEESKYIDSSLYAFALFDKYKKASQKGKKSLTKEINKTLSGDRTLEDTLSKLDITEKEGSKIIIKKMKEITRNQNETKKL